MFAIAGRYCRMLALSAGVAVPASGDIADRASTARQTAIFDHTELLYFLGSDRTYYSGIGSEPMIRAFICLMLYAALADANAEMQNPNTVVWFDCDALTSQKELFGYSIPFTSSIITTSFAMATNMKDTFYIKVLNENLARHIVAVNPADLQRLNIRIHTFNSYGDTIRFSLEYYSLEDAAKRVGSVITYDRATGKFLWLITAIDDAGTPTIRQESTCVPSRRPMNSIVFPPDLPPLTQ
jgi:hypothetical protein